MALQALADVSNLNIIPKSVVNWFVQTLTGIKAGAIAGKGGLMGNLAYLVIIIGGSVVALVAIVGLALVAKKSKM